MSRFFSFTIIIFISLVSPLWLAAGVWVLYALRWFALELLFVVACIDIYFSPHGVPWYLFTATFVLLVCESYKKVSSLYTG